MLKPFTRSLLALALIAPLPASGGAPVRDDSDDDPIGV